MPRRYCRKLAQNRLNSSLYLQTKVQKQEQEQPNPPDSDESEEFSENEIDADSDVEEVDLDGTGAKGNAHYSNSILSTTPHFSHAALNVGLGQCRPSAQMLTFPGCTVTVPMPLYIADCHTPIMEPCVVRPGAHNEWMIFVQRHHMLYNARTKRMKQRQKKHANNIYNGHLFELAECIGAQEEPYFHDSYDYHYTGGNLTVVEYQQRPLAIHTSGAKLRNLHFSQLSKDASQMVPLHSASMDEFSSEIFQVQGVRSFRVNHGNMFLARCLNEIALYELKKEEQAEEDGYQLLCQGKYSSQEGPFISAAQDTHKDNILALACQDNSVRFVDLVESKDVSKHDVCIVTGLRQSSSAWSQLCPATLDSHFYYACQPVLLTIDPRCPSEQINPCFASSAYSQQCESFSCLTRSVNPYLLYVASNHKLHCLDMRCLGKKIADRSVVTWTHQMSYPPTFMDSCVYEGSEYVAACSPLPSDMRIFELTGPIADNISGMGSPALPYEPPNLREALIDARLRGHVDVYADLGERIKACVTGLKIHQFDEAASDGAFGQILTSNSVGDVYSQRLTERDVQEEEEELRKGLHTTEVIRYYGNLVRSKLKKRPLYCTEIQKIPELREIMKTDREVEIEEAVEEKELTIDYGMADDSDSENEEQSSEKDPETQPNGSSEKDPETQPNGSSENDPKTQPNQEKEKAPLPPPVDKAVTSNPPVVKNVAKDKKIKVVNRGPWQKSAYALNKFSDIITSRLISVWDLEKDYDMTRDVNISMIDEKLKTDHPEEAKVNLTETWLNKLSEATPENERKFVPGTDLPTRYDAKFADYMEIQNETTFVELEDMFKTEPADTSFNRLPHSTLAPDEFTAIEYHFEDTPNATPPKRAKIIKSKYKKGF